VKVLLRVAGLLTFLIVALMPGRAGAAPSPGRGAVTSYPGLLNGVSATSASNAWAVGSAGGGSTPVKTLVLHWNGTRWTRASSPSPGGKHGTFLYGVSADSASDAWAVGDVYTATGGHSLALHWNGARWLPVPIPCCDLSRGERDSPSGAWAFGVASGGGALVAHWNGTSWRQVSAPVLASNVVNAISAVSPSDVWAAGFHGTAKGPQTLVARWNGTSWKRITTPDPAPDGSELWAVSARSASDAWAVGDYSRPGIHTLTLHWNGSDMRQVASPHPGASRPDGGGSLLGVDAVSSSDAWAVGAYSGPNLVQDTLVLHWNGSRWTHVASPTPGPGAQLSSVSAVSGSDAWAAGSIDSAGPGNVLLLHWNGRKWERS
jgi:hypothetical protein